MLIVRAVLSFLALPVVVAGLIPAVLTHGGSVDADLAGMGLAGMAIGVALLLWCVRDFLVIGRGTLAPWDPPRHLVVVGLYRYVRNPMYVAVLVTVAAWALLYWSLVLAGYAVALAVAFHVRVKVAEEPSLRRKFGEEWDHYCRSTHRWLPAKKRNARHRDGRGASP